MEEQRKGNAWALLPLLLFIALFLGVGTITGDFTNMPLKCSYHDYCYCCFNNE